jgi:hypothetical protein
MVTSAEVLGCSHLNRLQDLEVRVWVCPVVWQTNDYRTLDSA